MILKSLVEKELQEIEQWIERQRGYNHETKQAWPRMETLISMVRELVSRVNELEGKK